MHTTRSQYPGRKTQSINVTIVGDPGVGKSCLLRQIVRDNTFLTNLDVDPTQVAEFGVLQHLSGATMVHTCITFAGMSEYYASNADVCIFCYDVTRQKTFKNLRNKWIGPTLTHCRQKDTTPRFIILGLKVDGAEDNDDGIFDLTKRQVLTSAGEILADEVRALFAEVSVKRQSGRHLTSIVEELVLKAMQHEVTISGWRLGSVRLPVGPISESLGQASLSSQQGSAVGVPSLPLSQALKRKNGINRCHRHSIDETCKCAPQPTLRNKCGRRNVTKCFAINTICKRWNEHHAHY